MDKNLIYLCAAVSLAWCCYFSYLIVLHLQLKDIKRRLDVREECDANE